MSKHENNVELNVINFVYFSLETGDCLFITYNEFTMLQIRRGNKGE